MVEYHFLNSWIPLAYRSRSKFHFGRIQGNSHIDWLCPHGHLPYDTNLLNFLVEKYSFEVKEYKRKKEGVGENQIHNIQYWSSSHRPLDHHSQTQRKGTQQGYEEIEITAVNVTIQGNPNLDIAIMYLYKFKIRLWCKFKSYRCQSIFLFMLIFRVSVESIRLFLQRERYIILWERPNLLHNNLQDCAFI